MAFTPTPTRSAAALAAAEALAATHDIARGRVEAREARAAAWNRLADGLLAEPFHEDQDVTAAVLLAVQAAAEADLEARG
ncbi:hypothetical protein [Natronoglycomyces albus]|uniref:Uncharacterized protein n=1 Tax=Natronoglycomyces albus TaxID=2811108 RepID=A0A895XY59_9ACTN|nr:hypothetical protein [Natronoglycomyces albus]QSB07130.1 hypothetical protein JQS30_16850 [Natronoglycomyces albus]